ncbi:hypothetical protein KYK30_29955 [Shinella yambaruensis]|uniref:PilZ domain-containing protein n=1 Tax=Shinella yambaruensis TaxID=415996 RepID=A0ABQ5ZDL3_9HYPH|nr:hypothetical protein [Shinella yambaruensis]MCJ8028699.1 hypothetical protein [Shinella yambaruensis]MCU7983948.1 hypothetical protein [Shinella yambaruensis]GLR49937.1 hypothetical protein GCM10007923_11420 [Shinella yambaruensis]
MPLEHVHDQLRLRHPKRSFVQYRIDRPGFVTPIGHHLSTAMRYTCLIRSISSAGAVLSINKTLTLPENFYLEIHGIRDEIPCTEFKRDGEELVVRFNMFLDTDFLDLVLGRAPQDHRA